MNGDASFGDECRQVMAIVAAQEASISKPRSRGGRHDERLTVLMVAVGGSSLACYWLMTRVQNAAARSNDRRQLRLQQWQHL
jgi:hypothetical protein